MSRIRALLPLLVVLFWLPPASADVLWEPYQSTLDGFSILFPGKPEKLDKDFGNGAIFHQFLVDGGDTAFMVLYTQYAPGTFVGKDAKLILDKSKESLLAGQKATVRVDRPFMFGTTPAREFIIDDEHGSTQVYRFYLVLDRLYQVICGGPKGFETSQEAQRFQNSFRLIAH